MKKIARNKVVLKEYKPQGLYKLGDESKTLYMLKSGKVQISTPARERSTLSKSEIFGTECLTGGKRLGNAKVIEFARIFEIDFRNFDLDSYKKNLVTPKVVTVGQILRKSELLSGMHKEGISNAESSAIPVWFDSGEVVFREGKCSGGKIFIVKKGTVMAKKNEMKIKKYEKLQILGEDAIFGPKSKRQYTAVAEGNTELYEINIAPAILRRSSTCSESTTQVCTLSIQCHNSKDQRMESTALSESSVRKNQPVDDIKKTDYQVKSYKPRWKQPSESLTPKFVKGK